MSTLVQAWIDGGGQVIGLAPSAAAAAQIRDATGAPAETLAKLTWSIHHNELPDWAERISRSTLVIIDEAGMADTLTLDTAVQFIIGRGGSIRLVGDDQQLAAIGAGGVLRDIQASHGALRLTELHRFTDPAEAAATLAVRDGRPEALGFYLDRQRVHVGDPTTTLDGVFNAWQNDCNQSLDAIMLAPTRELVGSLNQRARDHRLAGATPRRQVELADGNAASVGDLIITRSNDRRLRITATDWVKNGNRWTILKLTRNGGLKVRHAQNGRMVTLPANYVRTAAELGYATTVHTAQGVTDQLPQMPNHEPATANALPATRRITTTTDMRSACLLKPLYQYQGGRFAPLRALRVSSLRPLAGRHQELGGSRVAAPNPVTA
jgi:ATP-dependent exoDNAse (exonuclease V) alpha subunit